MIIYNPLDGDALTSTVPSRPRHCFLMTRLGRPIPPEVDRVRKAITEGCRSVNYKVIDASSKITGRDFLLKIWKQIASAPLAVGICHEDIPAKTQANIWYELGVAQAMGKETLIVKSPRTDIPSDFVRTEYIEFNSEFTGSFAQYLASLDEQARHYEVVADQLEKNPVLAIDYLKRAYLISGDSKLQKKARALAQEAGLDVRAKNSVEALAAAF